MPKKAPSRGDSVVLQLPIHDVPPKKTSRKKAQPKKDPLAKAPAKRKRKTAATSTSPATTSTAASSAVGAAGAGAAPKTKKGGKKTIKQCILLIVKDAPKPFGLASIKKHLTTEHGWKAGTAFNNNVNKALKALVAEDRADFGKEGGSYHGGPSSASHPSSGGSDDDEEYVDCNGCNLSVPASDLRDCDYHESDARMCSMCMTSFYHSRAGSYGFYCSWCEDEYNNGSESD
eukprot:TRINITY_DN10762_c0_g1_i1.p1 TRINITY_DN10762_c0_g1~~TRINITY_DN10762_c0_g1_i1.p1  ORF type:complete len:231 (+),score=49.45 TRINITY_DN10762_c0_g1_i1:48-740(+)